MQMFYGYKRSPKDAPPYCEKVWLDDERTNRQERDDMILALRPAGADVVVVLAESDLGRGRELPAIRAAIEAKGATVSVEAPEQEPERRGRPAKFTPNADQDAKIRRLYRSYQVMSYVLTRATEIMRGFEVKAHHLKRRYGNRWDRK